MGIIYDFHEVSVRAHNEYAQVLPCYLSVLMTNMTNANSRTGSQGNPSAELPNPKRNSAGFDFSPVPTCANFIHCATCFSHCLQQVPARRGWWEISAVIIRDTVPCDTLLLSAAHILKLLNLVEKELRMRSGPSRAHEKTHDSSSLSQQQRDGAVAKNSGISVLEVT